MKYCIAIVVLLVVASNAVPNRSTELGVGRSDRLLNGQNTDVTNFPFMVSIQFYSVHYCSGTIINENWILTVARCTYGYSTWNMNIHAGISNVYDEVASVHSIGGVIYSPHFMNGEPWANDIAVMQVYPPFSFSDRIKPVVLPAQDQEVPAGSSSTAVGWGFACEDECLFVSDLQKVDIVTYSYEECSSVYGSLLLNSMICSGVPEEEKGICDEDLGGALVVDGVQVGVASWSKKPCGTVPGIWTRVAYFRNWIKENTGT